MTETPWYYVAAGAQAGPVSPDQLRALVASGAISRETLVWNQGLPAWQPLGQTALAATLPQPPGAVGPGNWPYPGGYAPGYPPGPVPAPASPGFGAAISICFSKYVVWAGRATRSEFWWFYLFGLLASWGASALDTAVLIGSGLSGARSLSTPFTTLVGLGLFLPQLSVYVRRLHDTGRSAWWALLPFGCIFGGALLVGILIAADAPGPAYLLVAIPVLAMFYPLVFMCQRGTQGPNRYG